jgi:hypothetical protein
MTFLMTLLAVLAAVPAGGAVRSRTCEIAIELQVEAPLEWEPLEWRRMTSEVERIWEPYGLSICWIDRDNPCPGHDVGLRVIISEELPPSSSARSPGAPVVGKILFGAKGPGMDIALSVKAARGLVAHSKINPLRLAWSAKSWDALVPRVLGRALAHEIGHYELGRGHTGHGLMMPSFYPNDVTFGPTSWFRLLPSQQSALQLRCPIHATSRLAFSHSTAPDAPQ